MEIRTSVVIAMGHRLMDYDGDCKNLHGHNWKVEVTIVGAMQKTGMVMEFKDFKKLVKNTLMPFDHSTILFADDPLATILLEHYQHVWKLSAPPTTENIASLFFNALDDAVRALQGDFALQTLTVHETENNVAIAYLGDIGVHLV